MLQLKDGVDEWKEKQEPYVLPIRDLLQIKRHIQTKRKEMEKDIALMDLEGIALNEMGQREKDKYHMISCTCGI